MVKKNQRSSSYHKSRQEARMQIFLAGEIGKLLREQDCIASVNRVEINRAGKYALVWLSVITGEDNTVLKAIANKKREFESKIFFEFSLPFKLELRFQVDQGPRHAEHIAEILEESNLKPTVNRKINSTLDDIRSLELLN